MWNIDTRTPYNANHVRMVADYVGRMADYINELHEKGLEEVNTAGFLTDEKKQELMEAFTEVYRGKQSELPICHDLGNPAP